MKYAVWLKGGHSLDPREVVEYAVAAEESGWNGVFLAEGIWEGWVDPWTQLGAVASVTEELTIGTWVTPIPQKIPWWLANAVATLDHISGGRVILGAGLGAHFEYEMFGSPHDMRALGRKYDEALEIITGLWKGEPFSFEGEFFTIREAKLPVTPVQRPRVPILMGCWWPNKKPFQRAARYDGIMPFWPALLGKEGGTAWGTPGVGPQGEEQTGTVEEELHDLLDYYYSLTDDPGEIFLPDRPDKGYRRLCKELGATWLFTTSIDSLDQLREGPPDGS